MNLSKPLRSVSRLLHSLYLRCRSHLPEQRSTTFGGLSGAKCSGIGPIFVINLDRQPGRMTDMVRELNGVLDANSHPLARRLVRFSACDGQASHYATATAGEDGTSDIDPTYTLRDQLFVEPQPLAMPDSFDLDRPIEMTRAEVAIAKSHIGVWREIAKSEASHALVLEDDVWFSRRFAQTLDHGWREMSGTSGEGPDFDVLYLSYEEARYGAPKELLSANVFRPERGLWYLSGYVLSQSGAQKLLKLLPCRGPVDLWMNQKYSNLVVRALRRSVVNQRRDLHSTNSYSILPALSQIGVIDSGEAALFRKKLTHAPVFAFGARDHGLSSVARALSMLGYRCCSDVSEIPIEEHSRLLRGSKNRQFDAYVNVGSLESQISHLVKIYPRAKYIVLGVNRESFNTETRRALSRVDTLHLDVESQDTWDALCRHLRLAPPDAPYPKVGDLGQRRVRPTRDEAKRQHESRRLRHDPSPWIARRVNDWVGIWLDAPDKPPVDSSQTIEFWDDFSQISGARWLLRTDTFPGNLGLFRAGNVAVVSGLGLTLSVAQDSLGVRQFSAAAVSSHDSFLFGRFDATLRATNVPGLVTGFFLHRNSPRQEIDIEIRGDRPHELLLNVFYNPGTDGAKFDYGYRGSPEIVNLGFDASAEFHLYSIEWDASEIRWFVDQQLVRRRAFWDPTPIPDLPMTLHVNAWPARSREFAGKLVTRFLPAAAVVRDIAVKSSS
jgi:GR25 family glycosyltransferase involved in LPS biosynthesis